jgi:hypothetical protein
LSRDARSIFDKLGSLGASHSADLDKESERMVWFEKKFDIVKERKKKGALWNL